MARNYKPKRFTKIGLLKKMDFPLLLRLLEPYRLYFEGHPDFVWAAKSDQFRFDVLAEIMLNLDTTIPKDLLESLYYIETMADNDYFDELLAAAQKRGFAPEGTDPTAVDLALWLRLECPEAVEQLHADIYRNDSKQRAKRFESYFPQHGIVKPMFKPDKITLARMQSDLDDWSRTHRRGIGMRVFITYDERAVWFMIRHGQPMKRENTVEANGEDGLVFYRPEKFDILIYYPESGELAIGVRTKSARIAYSRIIGDYLFNDPYYFNVAGCEKYMLDPVFENGMASLSCRDIPGLQQVFLQELHIDYPSKMICSETLKGDDVMAALTDEDWTRIRTRGGKPVRVKFLMVYTDGRERMVTIEPPNIALYDHETDHETIHLWLTERGFITNDNNMTIQGVFHDDRTEQILAVA